jgi:hypothetical protein
MVALVGGVLALSGCSGSGANGDDGKGPASSSDPSPTAKDGDNYDACSDGTCEVVVHKTATIKLDKGFEAKTLFVSVSGGQVNVRLNYPDGGTGTVSVSGNAQVAQNDLGFASPESHGSVAVVAITALS